MYADAEGGTRTHDTSFPFLDCCWCHINNTLFMITLPAELLLHIAVCPAVKRQSALFEREGEK